MVWWIWVFKSGCNADMLQPLKHHNADMLQPLKHHNNCFCIATIETSQQTSAIATASQPLKHHNKLLPVLLHHSH
jgi:hypothetical protein